MLPDATACMAWIPPKQACPLWLAAPRAGRRLMLSRRQVPGALCAPRIRPPCQVRNLGAPAWRLVAQPTTTARVYSRRRI